MRVKTGVLIIIILLFLVGTVEAAHGSVSGNSTWLVAGSGSSATYELTVTNSSMIPVEGATVTFSVDPVYGKISPVSVMTNSSGKAVTTFTVNKTSGTATILAFISYTGIDEPFNLTVPILQNIDHASAYYATFSHPLNGTVASQVLFNVSIRDQYGNPVDNRRGNHIISLHVTGPAPNDCGFAEAGFAHDISPILDANGNISLHVRLTQRIGDNNIAMDGYESIPNRLEWITAEAKGEPVSITAVVSPSGSPPTLPADGTSFFTIIYTLVDKYGNPTNGQSIWVNTSVSGEEKMFSSNVLGQVTVKYGPRSTIGDIVITATSFLKPEVNTTLNVKFKNTGAEIIYLTANPDTMPSNDKNPTFISNIFATVADHTGNAVPGETVTFSLTDITYDGAYNVTSDPDLLSTSDITDSDGVAGVQFRPGAFTTLGNPGYVAEATGHAKVIATWNGTNKTVPVHWKNYPYLSVSTSVTPLTVEVNQTIDVTIGFKGDGWAMQPNPIEVVLCTDRSGSMLYDDPDRMYSVREAGKNFTRELKPGTDKIGLVTFGISGSISRPGVNSGISLGEIDNTYFAPKTYSSYATFDRNLTTDFAQVRSDMDNIVPDYATPMRLGLYKSLKELNDLGQPSGTVKAVVLLSDGDYNYYGDPLARGSGSTNSASWYFENYGYHDLNPAYYRFSDLTNPDQNLSVYAKNSSIRIYSIGYADSLTSGGRTTLRILAEGSGGKYYDASAADIEDVYRAIAGDLKDTAGVNVTSLVDFEKVNVTGWEMNGSEVYTYVYHPTDSTKINWQNGTTNVIDQSIDWAADNKLDFEIGTIKVGQQWNATFRLRVNQSGLIDVFGKNSKVSFNGGSETLYLPQTFITVVPKLDVLNITSKEIKLKDLVVTEPGEIKVLLPVKWDTTYDGNKTLTERVYYQIDGGPWVLFDTKTHPYDLSTTEYTDFAQLDITKLPPGGYLIRVVATASDAPDDTITLADPVNIANRGRTFIKLQ